MNPRGQGKQTGGPGEYTSGIRGAGDALSAVLLRVQVVDEEDGAKRTHAIPGDHEPWLGQEVEETCGHAAAPVPQLRRKGQGASAFRPAEACPFIAQDAGAVYGDSLIPDLICGPMARARSA